MKGIDVSTQQGTINWKSVAASGIDFAMVKATQGRGEGLTTKHLRRFTDGKFKHNIVNATAAGIPCGVYHYMTAQNLSEAEDEADYFCDVIAPYRDKITLWAAVDVESVPHLRGLDRERLTAITSRFMDVVEQRGYKPMLYTNPDHICYRFLPGYFEADEIWLAHWTAGRPMDVPNLRIWQYGATGNQHDVKKGWANIADGRIPGINAACDVNEGYFEIAKPAEPEYKVGGKYTIKPGDKYSNGAPVPSRIVGETYTIARVTSNMILLQEIMSWVKI